MDVFELSEKLGACKLNEENDVDYKALYEQLQVEYVSSQNEIQRLQDISKKTTDNILISTLQSIGDDLYAKQVKAGNWNNSMFESIDKLKNDYAGTVGEDYLHKICQKCGIDSISNGTINSKDGTYDIKINEKMCEVKTARIGTNKSFQHESLRQTGCDFYIFVDIIPNSLYITILPKFDLSQRCQIIERKAHLRKGTSDVFKFDFSESNIRKAIKKGYAIKIDDTTTLDMVSEFIEKLIV